MRAVAAPSGRGDALADLAFFRPPPSAFRFGRSPLASASSRMGNGAGVRLAGYDYTTPNQYFITMVIEGRRPLLGDVRSGEFVPSPLGSQLLAAWEETLRARPWITADILQVMPDHLHAIIGWNQVPADRPAPLGAFVGQFKGKVSHRAYAAELLPTWDRVWQPGFWDRVIRDDGELQKIRRYIVNNPARLLLRQQQVSELMRKEQRESPTAK